MSFKYRLYGPDGADLGDAVYVQMIRAGEEIIFGPGLHRFRVLDVVPFDSEDSSYVAMLQVEAA